MQRHFGGTLSANSTAFSQTPPPKPPRTHHASKREPLLVTPDASKLINEQASTPSTAKFAATDAYSAMKAHFRSEVHRIRRSNEFNGVDGVDILEKFLVDNPTMFRKRQDAPHRETALKVLDQWLRENVIQPADRPPNGSPPLFDDSRRTKYTLMPECEHRLVIMRSSPTVRERDSSRDRASVDRKPSRTGSFKRFFSPSRLMRSDTGSTEGGRQTTRTLSIDDDESGLEEPRGIFRGGRAKAATTTAAPQVKRETSKSPSRFSLWGGGCKNKVNEEVRLYRAALFRLLTLVEVPVLDHLTNPERDQQGNASVSLLSSILSRMGMGGPADFDYEKSEVMDDLIGGAKFVQPVFPFFNYARIVVPDLFFEGGVTEADSSRQLKKWADMCLQGVVARLESLTRHAHAPLIPVEFAPILQAIEEQVLWQDSESKRLVLALQYLVLMLPTEMRNHLVNTVQWLGACRGTNLFFSLCTPRCVEVSARKVLGHDENMSHAADTLRQMLLPACIDRQGQMRLIEVMVEHRRLIGQRPDQLDHDLCNTTETQENAPPPVRYCVSTTPTRQEETNFQDKELAKMLEKILDHPRLSVKEKKEHLEQFKKNHRSAYVKYFPNLN